MMNNFRKWHILSLLGLAFFLSCNWMGKPQPGVLLNRQLIGEWKGGESSAARETYIFYENGTYYWDNGVQTRNGQWGMTGNKLDLDQGRAAPVSMVLNNNALTIGGKSFSRQPRKSNYQPKWTKSLIGRWRSGKNHYTFFSDGTYQFDQAGEIGHGFWDIQENTLFLDGKTTGTLPAEPLGKVIQLHGLTYSKSTRALYPNIDSPLARELTGEWHFEGQPSSGYDFYYNGTYMFWDGEITDYGTWDLKGKRLILDGDNRLQASIEFSADQLRWGNEVYRKAPETASLDWQEQLKGEWYSSEVASGQHLVFYGDSTFVSFVGQRRSRGHWEVLGNRIVLDGFDKYAEPFRIREDTLIWGDTRFVHTLEKTFPGWAFSKEGGQIIAVNLQTLEKSMLVSGIQRPNSTLEYRILSSVGPYVSLKVQYRDPSDEGQYFTVLNAETGQEVLLTELFPEEEVFKALQRNSTIRKAIPPEPRATNLQEILDWADGGCRMSMGENLLQSFAFYRLSGNRIQVHIGLPHGCPEEKGRLTVLPIELPVPSALKGYLEYAEQQKQLMRYQ